VPGELTWRQARSAQGQSSRPFATAAPSGGADTPAAPGGRAAGNRSQRRSAHPSTAAGASPSGPPRPLTRRERLRRRNRRLLWIFIPTAIVTVLAAVAGGLVLYFGPLLQLIQTSTGHTIARSNQEQGINVPTDILSGQRVNVLLLGSDNDQKFAAGHGLPGNGVLTQTIIVVSLDPATKTVDLISIPRDSWVHMPGTASCMKLDEIAGQGTSADQAIQFERTVVERDYGIPIWRYAWVGLAGFVKVIDTLGGVDVDVLHPIVDDAYPKDINNPDDPYAYQRLYIPAGPQHLNGEEALEYVRSRHADQAGDFGRSQRQQSVLLALEKKANTGNLVGKIPDLAKDLQGNILTDMTVTEITQVANFARGIAHQNIKQIVLAPPDYSAGEGNIYRPDGEQTYALLPNWQSVNQTIQATVHPDPAINQNQPCTVNPVPGQWSGQTTG
jgi:LCP family protein required for cell wall assembly